MKADSQPVNSNDLVEPREPKASSRLRPLLALGAIACAVVALAACGGGGASTGSGSGGDVGGTLTMAYPAFPATLDPGMGFSEYGPYYDLVYDSLLVLEPDGSFKPGLALSWEYGPRNLSFSMKLRPNVEFSDGTKLDAEAVKTWINHVATLPGGLGAQYMEDLKSIDVTGPLSLTVHFSKPTPLLEMVFSQYLETGSVGSPQAVKAGTLETHPVGTGPYMLDDANTVARDHYTFVPNPHYWDKSNVHWEKVVIKTIINPNAGLQALKTGQVEITYSQPVTSLDAAKSAGLEYVAPPTLVMALELGDREGKSLKPLGDVRVRQAINYAIDRDAIGNVVGDGQGEIIDQFAAKGDDSFDPALQDRYPYDPQKAKQLLAEAGYADGFSLPVLSLKLVEQDTLVQALAGQLAKVGIKVEPDIKPNIEEWVTELATTNHPAATLSWGRIPAVVNYHQLWGPNASQANSWGVSNPELNRIYDELTAAPPEESDEIARRMQKFLVDQAWFAPVVVTPLIELYSPDLEGVNATSDRNVPYAQEFQPAG